MITRKYLLSVELRNDSGDVIKKNFLAEYSSLFPNAAKAISLGGKKLMELHPDYQVYISFWGRL